MLGRRDRQERGEPHIEDFWLPTGTPGHSISASWFWPSGPVSPDVAGVVIVPGIVHEEQTMAVGLVALARELSAQGTPALLIDLAGTAQGSGSLVDPDVGPQWDADVRAAVRHVRDAGLEHVAVVGVRLGALIAAHALVEDPVDLLVLWAPVLSGRRYVRELQMMQASTEQVGGQFPGVNVAGFNLPPDLVDHLKRLDAAKLDGKPASHLCLVDSASRLDAVDDEHPLFAAVPVDRLVANDTEPWLFTAADAFPAPFDDLPAVARQVAFTLPATPAPASADDHRAPLQVPDVSAQRSQVFELDGVMVRETFVSFPMPEHGRRGATGRLTGVLSEPLVGGDRDVAVVAITTVGPGRIFVDIARREAARGRACLRFNLSGFGSSSRRPGEAWADFYHPAASAEIGAAVDHLRGLGFASTTVVGFCAGAWSAFGMPPRPDVSRIIAVNVQLMVRSRLPNRKVWPGLGPIDLALARSAQHPRFHRAMERVARLHPVPSPAIRRAGRHVAGGTDVTLVFSEGDSGLEYLERRIARPFGLPPERRPDIVSYADLGHLPSGHARDRMISDLHDLTGG